MKRVLVAGATGYLGGFVAQEFKNRGYFVRALVRSAKKLDGLWDSTDEIVEAQITQPKTLERICDGIDVVFSSVGITRQKDGLTFKDVDYQGNKNLLEVALAAGVKKFVYVSAFNGPELRHLEDRLGMSPRSRLSLGVTVTKMVKTMEDLNRELTKRVEEEEDPR